MIRLAGVLLLIGGAFGLSYSICKEQRKALFLLKELRYLYQLMQSEILYTGIPLPEIFIALSENLAEPVGSALREVGERMTLSEEEDFAVIWKKTMKAALDQSVLTNRQKESVLRLPEQMTFSAGSGQEVVLQRQIEELDKWILQTEEEEKNKNKVIMSLGIAAGIFLVIVLI